MKHVAFWVLPGLLVAIAGCPPRHKEVTQGPPPPLRPLAEQIATVNQNVQGITRTLKGGGINVSALIHEDGKEHRYDLDGKIRFLPSRYLYFDLSHLGMPSAVHIGSNEELFWVWVKPEQNRLWYGRWQDLHPADTAHLPLSPDMVLAATGLATLPTEGSGLRGPLARSDGQRYYKLLYSAGGENGLWVQREYWLDRYPPFLPRVIIFRNPDGKIRMQASLNDYRLVEGSAVYIARDVLMVWPKEADTLRIRFGDLKFDESIAASSAAFRLIEKRVPIRRDRWVRVTEEGQDDEEAQAAIAPASRRAAGSEPVRQVESGASTEPAATEPSAAPEMVPNSEPAATEPGTAVEEPAAPQEHEPAATQPEGSSSASQTSGFYGNDHDGSTARDAGGTATTAQGEACAPTMGPVEYQPGVMIDWSKKQVLLAGHIVLRQGDLELFACSPHTKEHETIVQVQCRPVHVFQAMGLIGLEPGRPPLYDNSTKKVVPATGERLDIRVQWTTEGQTKTVPIWEWLWNKQGNRPAGPVEWVFSGSQVTEDGQLLADMDGTVVTVVDFETALMSVPASHTSSNADLWMQAYTEKIPPVGTPVTVLIHATQKELTFSLDRFGRLTVDGKAATLREAVEAARRASRQTEGASAVIECSSEPASIEAGQLAMALREAGLPNVQIRQTSQGLSDNEGEAAWPAGLGFPEQGVVILETISDLGKQLPSAADRLARSVQAKYTRMSERATAAGKAAAGAMQAVEVMQGGPLRGQRVESGD